MPKFCQIEFVVRPEFPSLSGKTSIRTVDYVENNEVKETLFPSLSGKTSIRTFDAESIQRQLLGTVSIPFREDLHSDNDEVFAS